MVTHLGWTANDDSLKVATILTYTQKENYTSLLKSNIIHMPYIIV